MDSYLRLGSRRPLGGHGGPWADSVQAPATTLSGPWCRPSTGAPTGSYGGFLGSGVREPSGLAGPRSTHLSGGWGLTEVRWPEGNRGG